MVKYLLGHGWPMVEVRLSARCYPTEDPEKIVGAITGIFPDAKVEGTDSITAVSSSLDTFAELLKRQRIRDAARQVMRRNMHGNVTRFSINKQVAAVGKISFSEESHPLGDIEVTISAEGLESLIDVVAPNTRLEASR
jgi:predicted RNA binding protein with dsRBD fold (UPF0201 family)